MMEIPHITCRDCHVNVDAIGEDFMVNDYVWATAIGWPLGGIPDPGHASVFSRWGRLCVGCLENRIGRRLRPRDFTSAPLNWAWRFNVGRRLPSTRLLDRMLAGHEPPFRYMLTEVATLVERILMEYRAWTEVPT